MGRTTVPTVRHAAGWKPFRQEAWIGPNVWSPILAKQISGPRPVVDNETLPGPPDFRSTWPPALSVMSTLALV